MRTRRILRTLALAVWLCALLLSLLTLSKPGLFAPWAGGTTIEPGEKIAPRLIKAKPRSRLRRPPLLTRTALSSSAVQIS